MHIHLDLSKYITNCPSSASTNRYLLFNNDIYTDHDKSLHRQTVGLLYETALPPRLRVKDVTISHLNFYVIFLLARHLLTFRGKKNTHITWGESRIKNNKLGFIAQNKNGFAHGR